MAGTHFLIPPSFEKLELELEKYKNMTTIRKVQIITLFILVFLKTINTQAQVAINSDGADPDA
jgi:hypothetical protein